MASLIAFNLALCTPAQAGTQPLRTEDSAIGDTNEPSLRPGAAMLVEPIETPTLQRIDEQSLEAASELATLTRLADSPAIRAQLKSKRRPKGSTSLTEGNAAWTLGLIYLHGAGVPQNLSSAQQWFERAVALGTRQALAGLAWCAVDGCASRPQPDKAEQWTKPLRTINRPLALYLQWMAFDRLAPLQTATPNLQGGDNEPKLVAPELLAGAARGGNIHALIELGLHAVALGQDDKALAYFRSAADRSAVAAANAAIVAQGAKPKIAPLSDGNKVAMELLGQAQRFHRGEGVPTNYTEAIRLYRMAEAKGSSVAERMLALIYSRPLVQGQVDIAWINQLSELDLTQSTPSLRIKVSPRQLQRERTALVDLLPTKWRARIY